MRRTLDARPNAVDATPAARSMACSVPHRRPPASSSFNTPRKRSRSVSAAHWSKNVLRWSLNEADNEPCAESASRVERVTSGTRCCDAHVASTTAECNRTAHPCNPMTSAGSTAAFKASICAVTPSTLFCFHASTAKLKADAARPTTAASMESMWLVAAAMAASRTEEPAANLSRASMARREASPACDTACSARDIRR